MAGISVRFPLHGKSRLLEGHGRPSSPYTLYSKSVYSLLACARCTQVSQTKELVRYHTPGVLELHQELLRARESRNIAARQAWAELVAQVMWTSGGVQGCTRGVMGMRRR